MRVFVETDQEKSYDHTLSLWKRLSSWMRSGMEIEEASTMHLCTEVMQISSIRNNRAAQLETDPGPESQSDEIYVEIISDCGINFRRDGLFHMIKGQLNQEI